MGDMNCGICTEPYEVYNGGIDGLKWESELFLQGAGCPSCEGVSPFDEPTGMEKLARHEEEPQKPPPKWKRPEGELLWACGGCEVKAVISPDDEETHEWVGGDKVHYWRGRAYTWGEHPSVEDEPPAEAPFTLIVEDYCAGCAKWCDECVGGHPAVIFIRSDLEPGDSYGVGSSFSHPHSFSKSVCVDCFEELSDEDEEE